jgi:hypothetical protein|tara:strand:- start:6 stop:206 length:201 start_codon:yes stop_codon:yes gene_type:complete
MAIVKIEIKNDKIINIQGNEVTIMIIDYDGTKDMHFSKPCDVTLIDYNTVKETRKGEFTFTGNPDT